MAGIGDGFRGWIWNAVLVAKEAQSQVEAQPGHHPGHYPGHYPAVDEWGWESVQED